MRLVLPSGAKASSRTDENLVRAIAKAHNWWGQLVQNPKLRIRDLAAANHVSESWITRILRLAFLDPVIVEQVLHGKAPSNLNFDALRMPRSIPALWSAQREQHGINNSR